MLHTIPGLGNRGSSTTLRAASASWRPEGSGGQLVRPELWGRTVRDEYKEAVCSEAAEAARYDTLTGSDRAGNAARRGSGMRSDVREDYSVAAVPALQQVFTEQPGRADREAQRSGHGTVVPCLGTPRIHGAEQQEDRGGSAGRSKYGLRQMSLLGRE